MAKVTSEDFAERLLRSAEQAATIKRGMTRSLTPEEAVGWTVRHYKGGLYDVSTFTARLEWEGFDGELHAIYRHRETQQVWVRPVREFDDLVEVDGKMVRRFEPVPHDS